MAQAVRSITARSALPRAASGTAGVASFNTRTGAVTLTPADLASVGGAPLASPALTGTPTAPTATAGDADTSIATTAFVAQAIAAAPPPSPASTHGRAQSLSTADVVNAGGAPLASPIFTGNPQAPDPDARGPIFKARDNAVCRQCHRRRHGDKVQWTARCSRALALRCAKRRRRSHRLAELYRHPFRANRVTRHRDNASRLNRFRDRCNHGRDNRRCELQHADRRCHAATRRCHRRRWQPRSSRRP